MNTHNSEFFLEDYIEQVSSTEQAIVFILRARGFLIEEIKGRYFISDNACKEDVDYLEEMLKEYSIGRIVKSEVTYEKKTRSNRSIFSGTYEYYRIVPNSIELIIDKGADVDVCKIIFARSERIDCEACFQTRPWAQYAHDIYDTKVCVKWLESYVAYYVKAVSACGVFTNFSCDGNHVKGGSVRVGSDYASSIWHEFLWEYIVCEKFGNVPYIGSDKGIKFSNRTEQKNVYKKVYEIADFLYMNRKYIIELKKTTLETIRDRKYRRNHSKKEIEQQYRDDCRRVLSEPLVFLKGGK